MTKYKIILVFLSGCFYLLNSYYTYESLRKEQYSFLSDINTSIIDIPKRVIFEPTIISDANFTFWDMKESLILKNRKAKELLDIKKESKDNKKIGNEKGIDVHNRIICLDQECWELLGIVTINTKTIVTLLSKSKNGKLKTFSVNDMLLEDIKIIGIRGDNLFLKDIKKNKKFSLKLFDIDITKYIPKKSTKGKNE
jgi:hypothetical protein